MVFAIPLRQITDDEISPTYLAGLAKTTPVAANAAKHMLFLPTLTLPLKQIYHDNKIPAHLPGLCHRDNYIMT